MLRDDKMFQDSLIQDWVKEYGKVTSYSFIVYGPIVDEDLTMIQSGLTLRLMFKGQDASMFFIEETVTEELATALNLHRGIQINILFKKDITKFNDLIISTVSEGLTHLKLKHEFIGTRVVNECV